MPTPPTPRAQFVFRGTVVRPTGATMTVPEKSRTAVVRVDEVLRGPEMLARYAGQQITVQLAPKERLKKGQEAVFHTNGWLYGKSLAVQSLGHEAAPKGAAPKALAAAAAPGAPAPDPAVAERRRRIEGRAAQADLVVSGKVVAVGLPEPPAARAATAAAGAAPLPRPVSEHDPFWREAVVDVNQVHKGRKGLKRVTVRFPDSTDVRWYHAPKFQAGQEGVFLLRKDQVSEHTSGPTALAAMADAPAAAQAFTCLNQNDFIPEHHDADAQAAVAAATGQP